MKKIRLFTPGPTPVPERVALRMAGPMVHHRTKEFKDIMQRVSENLRYLFQTNQNVYILTSSGSGAMEAAVANLFASGEKALTIEGGKFGQRWGELCEAYNVPVARHQVKWGEAIQPSDLKQLLQQDQYKAVFLTHCETSTGVFSDLKTLAEVIKQNSNALIVVDGITSVGALPLKMDEWGLDAVVCGSQKAFMIPPGLSFIACSDKAWEAVERSDSSRYYFDLRKAKKSLEDFNTPFTPAITLILGLDEALNMMREEGLESIWERHQKLGRATRAAVTALGLEIFAATPVDSLTAVKIPESLKKKDLVQQIKSRGYTVAGGQAKLKGDIFRISHLGYYDEQDLLGVISILEQVLLDLGWQCEAGFALSSFQKALLQDTKLGGGQ